MRITEELLARRAAELNGGGGPLGAAELDLHGLGLERLELLGALCRRLRVLHLQNNLIPRIEGLHRLKARRRSCPGAPGDRRRPPPAAARLHPPTAHPAAAALPGCPSPLPHPRRSSRS